MANKRHEYQVSIGLNVSSVACADIEAVKPNTTTIVRIYFFM